MADANVKNADDVVTGCVQLHYIEKSSTVLNFDNEQELIERFQNGDTEAFNPLVLKYEKKVYNLIYQRVRDRETAKDLCQETFLKAFQALANFKRESAFYSWLYRIAVNCSIDFLRKSKRSPAFRFEELTLSADDELRMAESQPSASQAIENKELGSIIRKAVRHLSPGQQRVFNLRYYKELQIKEIAALLNRSEGTVKTHLHHAHRRLRDMLLPYLQNEPLTWNGET